MKGKNTAESMTIGDMRDRINARIDNIIDVLRTHAKRPDGLEDVQRSSDSILRLIKEREELLARANNLSLFAGLDISEP